MSSSPLSVENLAARMRECLDWPANAPLTRGVFGLDVNKVEELFWDWLEAMTPPEKHNVLWAFIRSGGVSVWGLADCMTLLCGETGHYALQVAIKRLSIPPGFLRAGLTWRHDLEIRGRRFVATKGFDFYFGEVEKSHELSAHELLELRLSWRDAGCIEGYDSEFITHFPEVLTRHQAWLRGEEGAERAQLCGCDLREVSFGAADLRGADLRGAILRNLPLDGFDLRECDLRGADLGAVSMVDADVRGADLRNCDLWFTNLEGAQWDGTRIEEHQRSYFQPKPCFGSVPYSDRDWKPGENPDYDFSSLDLRGRDFRGWQLDHSRNDFSNCDLRYTRFDCGSLNANFSGADLRAASFRATNVLPGSGFDGADLRGVDVTGANFQGVALDTAQIEGLIGADRAHWDKSPPRNLNFRGFCWDNVYLRDRNFSGCDLRGASFRLARVESCSFTEADLRGTQWTGAESAYCNFAHADLRGSDLGESHFEEYADFCGADLRGCTAPGTKFGEGAQFDGANLRGAVFLHTTFPDNALSGAETGQGAWDEANLDFCEFLTPNETDEHFLFDIDEGFG